MFATATLINSKADFSRTYKMLSGLSIVISVAFQVLAYFVEDGANHLSILCLGAALVLRLVIASIGLHFARQPQASDWTAGKAKSEHVVSLVLNIALAAIALFSDFTPMLVSLLAASIFAVVIPLLAWKD